MISSKQVIVNDLLSVLSLLVLASRKEGEEGEELLIPTIAVLARTRCGSYRSLASAILKRSRVLLNLVV